MNTNTRLIFTRNASFRMGDGFLLNAFWGGGGAYDGEDEDDGGRERWITGLAPG